MGPPGSLWLSLLLRKLAGVLGRDGFLPGPGLSSLPEAHEGKYLAVWPSWYNIPKRSGTKAHHRQPF